MGHSLLLEETISAIVPHIFKRPILQVSPADPFLTIATFLALGPKIYVDGLVVLDGGRAVGVIGGRHAIEYILYHPTNWFHGRASDVMISSSTVLDSGRRLIDALDIFDASGFAFIPIASGQQVAGTLSVRDILRVAVASKLETPVDRIASKAISTDIKSSVGAVLELMLEENVRNMIVSGDTNKGIVNDRMILEYLSSHNGRQMTLDGLQALYEIEIESLGPENVPQIDPETPASLAADRMLGSGAPCLLVNDNAIVTPWDIVMKGLMR